MRHDAEREQAALAAENAQLRAALEGAQQAAEAEALELRGALATLQARLRAEEQRSSGLQVRARVFSAEGFCVQGFCGRAVRLPPAQGREGGGR